MAITALDLAMKSGNKQIVGLLSLLSSSGGKKITLKSNDPKSSMSSRLLPIGMKNSPSDQSCLISTETIKLSVLIADDNAPIRNRGRS